MANILEEVRKFVREEFEKQDSFRKLSYQNHFVVVVKYALELAEKEKADKEIVEISAWLHDIGCIVHKSQENHHISSAKIAEDLLTRLNYPKDKIEKVKHCILSHRGSVNIKRETKEAQILADADALSHFDVAKELVSVFGTKEAVLKKLERDYAKMSGYARSIIDYKFNKIKEELS